MTRSDRRDLVVIRAGASWDGTRLADRHIASWLSRRVDVLYVDPPMSFRDPRNDPRLAPSAAEPVLRPLGERMWRLTPRVPPRRQYPVLREFADALVARALRRALRRLPDHRVVAVLSVSPDALGVLPGLQVHWARDDYSAGGGLMGVPSRRLERDDERTAAAADLVIAVSPALVRKWNGRGLPTELVPNGVDAELFGRDRPRPADMPDTTPTVGFCGTISARIDVELVREVADAGLDVVLLGARQHTLDPTAVDALLLGGHAHWLGERSYEHLPAYMQAMDVGLVPYVDSAFNRSSFPLKILEYLAAGLPVVSTELPALDVLDTDLVTVAGRGGFADAVREQLPTRDDAALVAERKDLAAQHSWERRADAIARALRL